MEVAFHLKKVRQRKGWSQRRLAASSGVSQAHVCDIENGRSRPSLDVAKRLADSLGESLDKMTSVKWTLMEALAPLTHDTLTHVTE